MANTTFFGVTSIAKPTLGDTLETNIISYLNWSFLTIGGMTNVSLNQNDTFGKAQSNLRLATDPNYTQNTVWEGFRTNWVWESGINFQYGNATNPYKPSGVLVNGVWQTSGFYVDYPNGRIVFNSPVSPSAIVKTTYASKFVSVFPDSNPWFRKLLVDTLEIGSDFTSVSGLRSVQPYSRIQLPAIFVDVNSTLSYDPWQLGGGQIQKNKVVLHCFTEDDSSNKRLMDILSFQQDARINMFDIGSGFNKMLDYRGAITSGTRTYPELLNLYPKGNFVIRKASAKSERFIAPLYYSTIIWDLDLYLYYIQ